MRPRLSVPKLRERVQGALCLLGNELLGKNPALHDMLRKGDLGAEDFYNELIAHCYRMIFALMQGQSPATRFPAHWGDCSLNEPTEKELRQLLAQDVEQVQAQDLGFVYEQLLELAPHVDEKKPTFQLRELMGNQRKRTGCYYSPESLVEEMLNTALDPLISSCKTEEELLRLRIIDPACGSGQFLIPAARRLARALAEYRGGYEQALQAVISECIYGLDINPMAVELLRMSLWMEADRAIPFSSLEQHVRCGNALLGFRDWDAIPAADAYALLAELQIDTDSCGVFHWSEHFGSVIEAGGFDCVLGNPPWEKFTFNEREWFANRCPEIAAASGSKRKKLIEQLALGDNSSLYEQFDRARHLVAAQGQFYHIKEQPWAQFPYSGHGIVNSYALFTERCLAILHPRGRAGIIVPTGIATDASTRALFSHMVRTKRIVSLYDFENKQRLFPDVHSSYRFCCLTLGHSEHIDLAVYLHRLEDKEDARRHVRLSPEQLLLINPNTGNCPALRSQEDARLTLSIYERVPILLQKKPLHNPWQLQFCQMFNMTSDSHCFAEKAGEGLLPLYEGKHIHQYDPHWVGERGGSAPRYWVSQDRVESRLAQRSKGYLLGIRGISCATNERTCIAAFIPLLATGNSLPLLLSPQPAELQCCLLANINSLVLDYIARSKVGGSNLNLYIIEQLPILAPEAYAAADIAYIAPRVLELSYTTEGLQALAEAMGYKGEPFSTDTQRRAQLRAELDAYYALLYGLSMKELAFILDPSTFYGKKDCPSVTFPSLQKNDMAQHGEYRTQIGVLDAYRRLQKSVKKKA